MQQIYRDILSERLYRMCQYTMNAYIGTYTEHMLQYIKVYHFLHSFGRWAKNGQESPFKLTGKRRI